MAQRHETYADVRCPACGAWRRITSRQHRRVLTGEADSRCRPCRYELSERRPPDDGDRAHWLERFDDETLAEWCQLFFGRGEVAAVRAWRERLTAG